jgi:hypothetical protein
MSGQKSKANVSASSIVNEDKQFDNDWKMTINRLFNNGLEEEKFSLLKKRNN